MKNILVTGGFGFIGGHLVERLVQNPDNHVHVIDNLSSCPIPYERLLKELGHPKNLAYALNSIFQYHIFCKNIGWGKPYQEIYHLASPVGPAGVLKYAGKMVEMVVNDIYAVMRMAMCDDAMLVDVSTSEVYGGGADGLCVEHMDKVVPADVTIRLEYAMAKLAAEVAIINTCKVTDLKAAIVRPFNVAGPRQSSDGGFVLPRFIEQAMNGELMTVFGDGTQIRAFTHVSDIVDGLIAVMATGRMKGDIYNLGNPANKIAINDLAASVGRIVPETTGIVHCDPKAVYGELYAEAAEKFPDATKAIEGLGWQPKWDVDATVQSAYEYCLHGDEGKL